MQKLVRDLVPDIIREGGGSPKVRVLHGDKDYLEALNAKLHEELKEYDESHSLEELADIIEVVEALREHVEKLSGGELGRVRAEKRATKGGFVTRQYLVSV
jgi:predicted house-cleaning noncanonical NTP pyrophosphatase (MazG superfamily)